MLVVRDEATGGVYLVDVTERTRRYVFAGEAPLPHPHDERVLYIDAGGDLSVWSPAEGERALTSGFAGVSRGTWSPDGRELAYVAADEDSYNYVWAVSRRSGEPRRLTDDTNPC